MAILSSEPTSLVGSLPVTSTHAAILTIAFVLANLAVARARAASGKFYGTEPNSALEFCNRAAAMLTAKERQAATYSFRPDFCLPGTIQEFSSVGLILIALLEAQQALGSGSLWWFAFLFTSLRIGHAVQLSSPKQIPLLFRIVGFWFTLVLLLFGSIKLLRASK